MSKKFDPSALAIRPRTSNDTANKTVVHSVHHEMAVRGATRLATPVREFNPKFQIPHIRISDHNPRKTELVKAQVAAETIAAAKRNEGESITSWRDRYPAHLPPFLQADDLKIWEELFTLAQSIDQIGLLEPIVLDMDNTIVAGERRYWALTLLGLLHAPVLHKEIDEGTRPLAALFENTQRSDLSLASLIPAYLQILMALYQVRQWDAASRKRVLRLPCVMDTFALSKQTASKVLRVCRAWSNDHEVKDRIIDGRITTLHAAYKFCDDIKSEKDNAKARATVSLPPLRSPSATLSLLRILSSVPALNAVLNKAMGSLQEASKKEDFLVLAEAALKEVFTTLETNIDPKPTNPEVSDSDIEPDATNSAIA